MLLCLPRRLWPGYQCAIGTPQFVWLGCGAVVLNILEFADKIINNHDESDGSSGKLQFSKVFKEKNSDISMGWDKEKGGGTTTG